MGQRDTSGTATGGGGNAGAGAGQGGGGWDWLLPVLGAAGNYFGAQQANRPSTTTGSSSNTTTTSPYGPAGPLIDLGLGAALDNFLNFRPKPPPGAGIGKDTNAMLGRVTGMANGESPFLGPTGDFYGSVFSDPMGNNALREMLVGGLNQPLPYVDDFIGTTTGQGGAAGGTFLGGSNALLSSLFGELMGGPQAGGGGGGRSANFRASGGGGGSDSVRDVENSFLAPHLMKVIEGGWLGQDNPNVSGMISNFNREAAEGYKQGVVPQIDAQYQRAGRYGSGAYQQAQAGANEEYNESVQGNIANLLGSTYQFERGNMMDALMGALGEETSREGIAAGERASGASTAAGAASAQASLDLQRRLGTLGITADLLGGLSDFSQGTQGLGLSAMGLLSDDRLGRLGILGDQATGLDQYRLGAMGLAPGLEEARYYGPLQALNAMGQRDSRNSAAANARNRFNNEMPFRMLNEFMGTVMPIATSFGTTTGSGEQSSTQPGAGINQWMAALQGLLGGAMANRGMTGRS